MERENFDFQIVKQTAERAFRFKDIDLSTARGKNNPEKIELAGRFLYIAVEAFDDEFTISSTKTVGVGTVSMNDKFAAPIEIAAGRVYRIREGFENLYLRNTAQANAMMRIYASVNSEVEPFKSTVEIIGGAGGNIDNTADVAVAATTTTQVLPVNPSRQKAVVSNLQVNGTIIRVGDSTTGAASGAEVPIGGSITIESTDAIYVYNPAASGINIGLSEVEQ